MKKGHASIRHTMVHLGSTAFVFGLAVVVGVMSQHLNPRAVQLAQTSGSMETMTSTGALPVISGVQVVNMTSGDVRIVWATDQPSDSRVWYTPSQSTTGSGMISMERCDGGGLVVSHCVELRSLVPGTTYVFKVESTNSAGMTAFLFGPAFTVPPTSGNTSTDGGNLTSPSVQLLPVSFAVSVAQDGAFCENGIRKTVVALLVSPLNGGNIRLTRLQDSWQQVLDTIPIALENGTYRWEGIALPGFRIEGNTGGEFMLSGACPSTTINPLDTLIGSDANEGAILPPPPPTSPTPSLPPPTSPTTTAPLSTIQDLVLTKVFMGTTAVSLGGIVRGNVELRVATDDAVSVNFIDIGTTIVPIGRASIDDGLSSVKTDVWVYYWDTKTYPNRTYRIVAKLKGADGLMTETLPFTLVVQNPSPAQTTQPTSSVLTAPVTALPSTSSVTEEENMLTRVASPEACATPRECELYCAASMEKKEFCLTFVNDIIVVEEEMGYEQPSTTSDRIADEVLEIPDARFLNRFVDERKGARIFVDSDGDGISDFDEINLYLTNPAAFDTDGDGAPDGAELVARTNPVGNSFSTSTTNAQAGETILTQNPKSTGVEAQELFAVDAITVVATTTSPAGEARASRIAFNGRTLPNTFVTLYIFSDPIVVTVKSDALGVWTYVLDKELPDGSHELYTAIADAGGKLVARSQPFPFVKQAAAVTIGSEPILATPQAAPGFFSTPALVALLSIIIGVLGIAISIIGFTVKHHHAAGQPLAS